MYRPGIEILLFSLAMAVSHGAHGDEREATVCGWFKERLMFKLWSSSAPAADKSRSSPNPLIEAVDYQTSDQRTLRGYIYRAHGRDDSRVEPRGYILMALGNAMIADGMIGYLKLFAGRGYDVYIFDYRGYGLSDGKRRIKAFIADYRELTQHLNPQYQRHLLYGVSLGGAVVVNAIGSGAEFHRAVIDSSPSRFSPYGCPRWIDPAEHVPDQAANMLVITGARDSVLAPAMLSELRERAQAKGAAVYHGAAYGHPFMDADADVHNDRMHRIIDFLDTSLPADADARPAAGRG